MRPEIPEIDPSGVPDELPAGVVVLDVREDDEWAAGHIPGAQHVPLQQVPHRLGELTPDARVLVVCKVGGRSAQATAYLRAHGFDAINLAGGMQAWQAARRPMEADGDVAPRVV